MSNGTPPQASNRPYPPPGTVAALLQRLRSRNLPERIDAEYLRDAGIPDSLNARTLFALRFLHLLDGDTPTAGLRAIAISTDEEYRDVLAGLIREAYQDVFAVIDPAQDPQNRIVNFFRRYTPASQRDRMVTFFLGICREAGIPTLDAPRNRASTATTATKPSSAKTTKPKAPKPASRDSERQAPPPPSGGERSYSGSAIPPALELLVRSLPPIGTPMSQSRQEQWLEMARATLAFVYPEEGNNGFEDQQDDELADEE